VAREVPDLTLFQDIPPHIYALRVATSTLYVIQVRVTTYRAVPDSNLNKLLVSGDIP
jgi:hypothetical protein